MSEIDKKSRRRYGEHIREKRKRSNESVRRTKIRKAIEIGNEALAEEEFFRVACIACDKLAPILLEDKSVREYDAKLSEEDENWHVSALSRFLDNSDKYTAILGGKRAEQAANVLSYQSRGYKSPVRAAKETTIEAFLSLEAIAIEEDIVKGELRNYATARGYSTVVGKMWKTPDMFIDDPLYAISRNSGLTKTLYHGGTGQGKSSTAGTDVYDRYNINHPDKDSGYFRQKGFSKKVSESLGEGMKIIDLLDLTEGENMVYDVPQQHEDLRAVRRREGLPETFEDSDDYLNPNLEILVPLTPDLNEQALPYNTETDEFSVTPFTIPACELSKPLLVSLLSSMVTGQQETTLRTAYDDVNRQIDDWSLRDLAEEIMNREDLGESYRKRVVKLLDNLQQMGFIRTKATSDKNLDWERVFGDTQTITSFSTAFMEDEVGKFILVGYFIDRIDDLRETADWPDLAIVARELHNLAPHRNETKYDARIEELQATIGKRLSRLMRENRHRGVSVIADTQDVLNLKKGFRKQFNRFITFNTSDENLQELFAYTSSDNWRSCSRSLTKRKGEGAIIGQARPLVEREDLDYLGHVAFVPSPHHHLDTDSEPAGWKARVKYLDNEELRVPNFPDAGVPEQLTIDQEAIDPEAVAKTPMEEFIDKALVITTNFSDWTHTAVVRTAYDTWAKANDKPQLSNPTQFGKRFNGTLGDKIDKGYRNGENAYLGVRLNSKGQDLAGRSN